MILRWLVLHRWLIGLALCLAVVGTVSAQGPTAASDTSINWQTIILAFLSLVGTTFTALCAVYMARVSATGAATLKNSEAAQVTSAAQAKSLEDVHKAVNSTASAAVEEIKKLREEVLAGAKANAALLEAAATARGMADQRAITAAQPTPPQFQPVPGAAASPLIAQAGTSLAAAGRSLKATAKRSRGKKRR